MRMRVTGFVIVWMAATMPLLAGATSAQAACKSPMKAGTWTGTVTQEFVVDGTTSSGLQVNERGESSGDLSLKVKCNGKATGTFDNGAFTLGGASSIAGLSFPIQCSGTTGERAVTGKVTKGAGGKPMIDFTYGPAASETFECAPGPLGDALNGAYATGGGPGVTTPDAPTGLSLPATTASKKAVRGTSFQSTGGFDPIAISTQSLAQLGLTPTVTQAWELTRS